MIAKFLLKKLSAHALLVVTFLWPLLFSQLANGQSGEDRAPELQEQVAEFVEVLEVRYRDNLTQHRRYYNTLRKVIRSWNTSRRTDADFELMSDWLGESLQWAAQGTGQKMPKSPQLSIRENTKNSTTPESEKPELPESLSESTPAQKQHVVQKLPTTPATLINIPELRSQIRGINRELQRIETKLSLSANLPAQGLAELAKSLEKIVEQRDFVALYTESLSKPEQARVLHMQEANTATALLAQRVKQLQHTLRRRGAKTEEQLRDRQLLLETNRILEELNGR